MTIRERLDFAEEKLKLSCREYETPNVGYWRGYRDAIEDVQKDQIESPRHDWTPCAEGLPESDQWCDDGFKKTYRVTVESDAGNLSPILGNPYRYVTTALFELGDWVLDSEDDEFEESDKVVAWMDQPTPYCADQKEDNADDHK